MDKEPTRSVNVGNHQPMACLASFYGKLRFYGNFSIEIQSMRGFSMTKTYAGIQNVSFLAIQEK
jgi:hypothetical protein